MHLLKLVSGSKSGYAPLNAENGVSVTFGFIVAYANEKTNILVSILNIIFFLFYDIYLNTQVLHTWNLSINWVSVDTCQLSRNATYAYLLYNCFIYRHVHTVFLYQNKLHIFPIIRLAFFLYWKPYYMQPLLFYIAKARFFNLLNVTMVSSH